MKIFMAKEFMDGSITIRIEINDKWIMLKGKESKDFMPVFGCDLNTSEQERFESWLACVVHDE